MADNSWMNWTMLLCFAFLFVDFAVVVVNVVDAAFDVDVDVVVDVGLKPS